MPRQMSVASELLRNPRAQEPAGMRTVSFRVSWQTVILPHDPRVIPRRRWFAAERQRNVQGSGNECSDE